MSNTLKSTRDQANSTKVKEDYNSKKEQKFNITRSLEYNIISVQQFINAKDHN